MGDAGSYVNLPQAIEAAIESATAVAGGKPVAVVAEYPAHLPEVVVDKAALTSVIASLIAHAMGPMESGEIKVRAAALSEVEVPVGSGAPPGRVAELGEGGPWALVRVSDPGHSVEEIDQFLGEGASAVPEGGAREGSPASAQGLRTCRRLVEGFGGRMWAERQPGGGTSICLALPFQAEVAEPDMTSLRRTVESRLPGGTTPPRTLLLVVDNPGLGDLLSRDLSAAGYGVMLSGNGSDGLTVARQTRPDLILLDLMARQPAAFDVAMLLKQDRRTRNIPVLFLTLVGDPKGEVSVRAVNFLVRPSGTGALVAAINALLTSGVSPSARVLVVEQDAAVRDMMVMMIQDQGYRVTEAAAAEEALALAERVGPGLILVNASLAKERDFWLLRRLRQVSADAGIFVLADGLSEADGRAAISRGASGYSDTGKLPDLLNKVRDRSARQ